MAVVDTVAVADRTVAVEIKVVVVVVVDDDVARIAE